MGKTVLILGNGFDLAHKLPTKYDDFLEFARIVTSLGPLEYSSSDREKDSVLDSIKDWGNVSQKNKSRREIAKILLNIYARRLGKEKILKKCSPDWVLNESTDDRIIEFLDYLDNNIWYKFLSMRNSSKGIRGENWIDFEREISDIVSILMRNYKKPSQLVFETYHRINGLGISKEEKEQFFLFWNELCTYLGDEISTTTVYRLSQILYDHLEKLIDALDIYLTDFVERIRINSSDIIQAIIKNVPNPDCVITFNYTNTYEKYYFGKKGIPIVGSVCHIHGECNSRERLGDSNMVLGIDKDSDTLEKGGGEEFSIFKKFVQRIIKKNDISYARWIAEIDAIAEENNFDIDVEESMIISGIQKGYSDIYIFGHSLDVTDKDILERFLMNRATKIHIFARNKVEEGDKMTNLLKLMTEDEVIRKSTNSPVMLDFIRCE